ncbi:magnesium transporter MgtC [Flavobacterium akiainvivens]|uniref:Magnesium transporter MgtC n=1 Tax=Flavobacterium akiainvivens TaxID=1202724 RepID=A0A0N0RR17_9FLAO|nr:MgtC/SapB family protein [Flavobacterium akiainvivens]KOS07822.1 magnesium transporter MgtC [Flavobacterium akiainvivens]SFQ27037.1 putative Mg2+ transporter-C (MgtC) family protein [Flavobacterium akiainvivens]
MLPWYEIALRLALAAILGGAIGIERERKDWAAGLRTHMMVSMGSALIMLVSSFGFQDVMGNEYAELDPSRVAAQIVSGIGFIGAGAILFLKPATVLGLTTASGLWTVAGIGMATGGGMYFAAVVATVFAILILWALQPIQRIFTSKNQMKSLRIVAKGKTEPKEIINKLLEDEDVDFSNFSISRDSKNLIIELILDKPGNKKLLKTTELLQKEPFIKKISWDK